MYLGDIFSLLKFVFDFIVFFVLGPGVVLLFIYRLLIRGGLRRFFLYEKKDSFFHRLDPRVKIFWAMTVTVLGAILDDLYVMLALFLWVVVMWLTAKPTRDKLITTIILLLPIPINAIFYQGIRYGYDWWERKFIFTVTPVYEMHPFMDYILGGHVLTLEGMYYGAFQSLRVLIAAGSGLLLAVSTAPNALLLGLTNFVKVGKYRIGVPYVLSFSIVIGIRLIPTMLEDANIVINAARVRGLTIATFRGRNPAKALKAFVRTARYFMYMVVPLIVSSLRKGSNMAIAADLRAFRAKPNRTYLIERKMSLRDWVFFIVSMAVFIAGWWYAYLGAAATPGIII